MEKLNSIGSAAALAGVTPSCIRCAFVFKRMIQNEIHPRFECRMAPPQIAAAAIRGHNIGSSVVFPQVEESVWCFQFTPAPGLS